MSSTGSDLPSLDFRSWTTLVVFILINITVIRPFTVALPLPWTTPRRAWHVRFDYGTGPLLGVLILIATTSIQGTDIVNGIVGNSQLQPYSILILFFALAYICVSLDLTGVFSFVALYATRRSGRSGKRLYLYFYLLTSVLTVFTSNDVVILTITPIICYFCHHIKTDPLPFLICQFTTANCWSLALYIGNPTNIIVAEAYSLPFFEYSAWMVLPSATAGIVAYIACRVLFRKVIPNEISPPDIHPSSALVDKAGALFGVIWLLLCLTVLIITSFFSVPVWIATLPFAVVMLCRDFVADLRQSARRPRKAPTSMPAESRDNIIHGGKDMTALRVRNSSPDKPGPIGHSFEALPPTSLSRRSSQSDSNSLSQASSPIRKSYDVLGDLSPSRPPTNGGSSVERAVLSKKDEDVRSPPGVVDGFGSANLLSSNVASSDSLAKTTGIQTIPMVNDSLISVSFADDRFGSSYPPVPSIQDRSGSSHAEWCQKRYYSIRSSFPTVMGAFERMPWKIGPFIIVMFILVEGLDSVGWVGLIAHGLGLGMANHGIFASVYVAGILTSFFCVILNNQPMTILFSKIFLHPAFADLVQPIEQKASLFALIMGSNFGANFAINGALAGLMWYSILQDKHIDISFWRFMKLGTIVTTPVVLCACLVLSLELYVMS